MSRGKSEDRNIRKLNRTGDGNTYTVSLPIEAIREFGWQKKQKIVVVVDKKGKRFIIKDWKK